MELNRVEIDVDKLILMIQAKGMTMEKFGYSIGRSRNYICSLRKNNMVPEPVRDLICEKLEIEPERIEKTQITSGGEVKILENIFKELQSIKTQISELADSQQAIYNKLQANTVQTARIKDVVDELGQTEYDRAELFLRETLKGGQVSAVELMQRADDAAHTAWEQACRSRWRALYLIVKAKLEAVEAGISTVEREFLYDIVLPDGRTAGEWIAPQIEMAYQTGQMPAMLPMLEN